MCGAHGGAPNNQIVWNGAIINVVGGSILLAAAIEAIAHAARNAASVRPPFAFVIFVVIVVVTHYLVHSFACPSLRIETDVGNYVTMIYVPYTPHTTSSLYGSDTFYSSHVHTAHVIRGI